MYQELYGIRGYIISQSVAVFPDAFESYKLPSQDYFSYDKNEDFFIETVRDGSSNDTWVAIYGEAIDLRYPSKKGQEIARDLADSLSQLELLFFNDLDYIGGRYIIIYSDNNNIKVLNDAAGLKTVFYSTCFNYISSHVALIKDNLIHHEHSEVFEFRKELANGYPGIETPYENIKILTPNTLINKSLNKVVRYFPRENLENGQVDEVVDSVYGYLKSYLEGLLYRSKLAISLTAGRDSRVTLAVAKGLYDDITFFTYSGHPAHEIDVEIAKVITKKLGLNHIIIDKGLGDDEKEDFKRMNKVLSQNTYYNHSRQLAYKYHKIFSSPVVHIRSNLAEIGISWYQQGGKKDFKSIDEFTRIYRKGREDNEAIIKAFRKFAETVEIDKLYNYDTYDMLYWEHRMGVWVSLVLLESDIAFDTHILFNARCILKLLMSVDFEKRIDSVVFNRLIEKYMMELSNIPINPKSL